MTFKHSGHLGDIIAGLPVIKQLGGGTLYIDDKILDPLSVDTIMMLKPLLESQKYINSVEAYNGQQVDCNLDEFRNIWCGGYNIAECQLDYFNLQFDLSQPWLEVSPVHKKGIVINRTQRHINPDINWDIFLKPYNDILFVGTPQEYYFMSRPDIDYYQVRDFLELASVIAGSNLFAGNQSFCWWIAEALKVNRMLEPWFASLDSAPHSDNGQYIQPNSIRGTSLGSEIWNSDSFETLFNKICGNRVRSYLEIGVCNGDSLVWQLEHAKSLQKVVLCDNWGVEYGGRGWNNHNHITERLNQYSIEDITYLDGDSSELIPKYFEAHDEMFDLVFIDGDHSWEGAKADILNTISHTQVLVIHDIYNPFHLYLRDLVYSIYNQYRGRFYLFDDGDNCIILVRKL